MEATEDAMDDNTEPTTSQPGPESEGKTEVEKSHKHWINLWHGRFKCSWTEWMRPTTAPTLKWYLFSPNNSQIPSTKDLDKTLPVYPIDKNELSKPEPGIRATWLGHASVLVQMEGLNILTDPVFSTRASFTQYAGPKRYRDAPCKVEDLPKIDAVVISHNHFDHLDEGTVRSLNARFDDIAWFVPKGVETWMRQTNSVNVEEFDWWQDLSFKGVKFVFTPAQHWSCRGLNDYNTTLWGSWCVLGKDQRFFFAGDTGYCPVFKEIGDCYGPFDLAALPIGAYEPRYMMGMQHVDPDQAVQIHQDIKAKRSLGIHWGTFALANEFYLEPPQKLREACEKFKVQEGAFFVLDHGKSWSSSDENKNEKIDIPKL